MKKYLPHIAFAIAFLTLVTLSTMHEIEKQEDLTIALADLTTEDASHTNNIDELAVSTKELRESVTDLREKVDELKVLVEKKTEKLDDTRTSR